MNMLPLKYPYVLLVFSSDIECFYLSKTSCRKCQLALRPWHRLRWKAMNHLKKNRSGSIFHFKIKLLILCAALVYCDFPYKMYAGKGSKTWISSVPLMKSSQIWGPALSVQRMLTQLQSSVWAGAWFCTWLLFSASVGLLVQTCVQLRTLSCLKSTRDCSSRGCYQLLCAVIMFSHSYHQWSSNIQYRIERIKSHGAWQNYAAKSAVNATLQTQLSLDLHCSPYSHLCKIW